MVKHSGENVGVRGPPSCSLAFTWEMAPAPQLRAEDKGKAAPQIPLPCLSWRTWGWCEGQDPNICFPFVQGLWDAGLHGDGTALFSHAAPMGSGPRGLTTLSGCRKYWHRVLTSLSPPTHQWRLSLTKPPLCRVTFNPHHHLARGSYDLGFMNCRSHLCGKELALGHRACAHTSPLPGLGCKSWALTHCAPAPPGLGGHLGRWRQLCFATCLRRAEKGLRVVVWGPQGSRAEPGSSFRTGGGPGEEGKQLGGARASRWVGVERDAPGPAPGTKGTPAHLAARPPTRQPGFKTEPRL